MGNVAHANMDGRSLQELNNIGGVFRIVPGTEFVFINVMFCYDYSGITSGTNIGRVYFLNEGLLNTTWRRDKLSRLSSTQIPNPQQSNSHCFQLLSF